MPPMPMIYFSILPKSMIPWRENGGRLIVINYSFQGEQNKGGSNLCKVSLPSGRWCKISVSGTTVRNYKEDIFRFVASEAIYTASHTANRRLKSKTRAKPSKPQAQNRSPSSIKTKIRLSKPQLAEKRYG